MKRVLMVAFQFPPFAGSSGVQRTLRFVQHLPALGWEPIILTASPFAYEACSVDLLDQVPRSAHVARAFALDSARHLALAGRYPGFLARPDRWMSWRIDAVRVGRKLIKHMRPAAIWSTYPIATAHGIASRLGRAGRLPWIADFRDPMAQEGYPADPATWRSYKSIEHDALHSAAASVFCTPGAARMYAERYPDVPGDAITVIENGYDEDSFDGIDAARDCATALNPGRLTLVHSGVVYPSERDPTQLFAALAQLKRDAGAVVAKLVILFRASGNDRMLRELGQRFGVSELVQLEGPLPYRQALLEMMRADGLLLLQASNCNAQIPAKLYEYLRSGRPILGLTDPSGDTALTLRAAGIATIAPLDSAPAIGSALMDFVAAIERGDAQFAQSAAVHASTRAARARQLAALLTRVTSA